MKGFITIATGAKHYYKIAANLLLSYRYFTKNPLPFAIIAEEKNEYTALFDDVIITTEAKRSFLDKFLLLKLCPYDETIFIDADSLAFGDLNVLWEQFADATDFSAIGANCGIEDVKTAWYNIEDLGEYGQGLTYKCKVHAGVCYIRNTDKVKTMYQDCMELYHNYEKMYFHTCPHSVDECVFGVAMPRNGMKTTSEDINLLAVYPFLVKIRASAWEGPFYCKTRWNAQTDHGILIHFGTANTHEALYRFNEEQLKLLPNYPEKDKVPLGKKILYKYKWRYFFLRIECGIKRMWKINIRRLKKLFSKKKK